MSRTWIGSSAHRPERGAHRRSPGAHAAALALLAALSLTACDAAVPGGPGGNAPVQSTPRVPTSVSPEPSATTPEPGSTTTAPASTAATSMTITLREDANGPTTTTTLTCEPAGGTHPDPVDACAAIDAAGGAAAFAPVPRTALCTQLYGGPQTATARGTVAGVAVDATFNRTNGCEIARWDRLAVVLGSVGGA